MKAMTPSQPVQPINVPPECEITRAQFRQYFEGSLTMNDGQALEAHLNGCAGCQVQLESYKRMYRLMDNTLGKRRLSPQFSQKAERVLRDTPEQLETKPAQRAAFVNAVPTGLLDRSRRVEDPELGSTSGPYDEIEPVAAPAPGFLDSLQASMGGAPWWVISGAFHGLLLLMLTLIGMAIYSAADEDTVIVTNLEQRREQEEIDPKKERDVFKNPVPIDMPVEVEQLTPVVTHEEVEVADHVETENDSDMQEAIGDEGISDVPLGGVGTVASIGLGGGGGGAFGRPTGAGGRMRRAIKGGGGKATESAVDAALAWLARNQEADGRWDVKKHGARDDTDVGVTGLALLAFLGAGHTEKIGKYKDNVKRATEYLISIQEKDGKNKGRITSPFRGNGYCHGVAGLALAEAAAMARNPKVMEAAQLAVNYSCEVHQDGEGSERLGWRYKAKEAGDTSVTGWYVMQLKSAKVAGLQIDPASFDGAMRYLDSVEIRDKNADMAYGGGQFRYSPGGHTGASISSVGMLSRLFLGTAPDELRGGAELLLQNLPEWKASSGGKHGVGGGHAMYYWYYGTLTMFQFGGAEWKQWNEAMKKTLVENQRKGGPEDGSWDPLATEGVRGGRVACTALGALSLEVYYRYLPMYK